MSTIIFLEAMYWSYNYTDSSGNAAITITRTVTVVDTTVPTLTLIGATSITQKVGVAYLDANAACQILSTVMVRSLPLACEYQCTWYI